MDHDPDRDSEFRGPVNLVQYIAMAFKMTVYWYGRTSVMFVSISFIVLMMISLAWLVFYYIQRFRYLHAKDRLSRELCNAAQKALSKIPTRSIKNSDKEVSEAECCAVCIEPYKASDVVRLLPCRHEFHKVCVDPWLLEHRTCPMCKMDILKHYGYVFTGSMESVINVDMDAPIIGGGLTGRPAQRPTPHSPTSSVSVPSSPDAASEQSRPRVSAVAAVHRSGASSSPPARRHWSWPRSLVRSSSANNRSAPAASSNSQPATDAQAPASQTQGASIQVEIEGNEATRQSCSENPDVPV